MSAAPHGLAIVGVYPVEPSDALFNETLEIQWGSGLSGEDLERARQHVRQHFDGLYLIEVQVEPADAEVPWAEITQPVPGQPPPNWQVPYDERVIDASQGRWAFFLHFVNLGEPLRTPVGPRSLPEPRPRPSYLSEVEYEAP
jgi:hypothetical protein